MHVSYCWQNILISVFPTFHHLARLINRFFFGGEETQNLSCLLLCPPLFCKCSLMWSRDSLELRGKFPLYACALLTSTGPAGVLQHIGVHEAHFWYIVVSRGHCLPTDSETLRKQGLTYYSYLKLENNCTHIPTIKVHTGDTILFVSNVIMTCDNTVDF